MREFICFDDNLENNGWRYQDEDEIMILGNDGVWQPMSEEKKQAGIEAITQSLTRTQSTTTENRNGNFNCTNE